MGLKADDLAKYAVYFCSAFMFLPAGRDVVAPGASVLPDDDKLLAAALNVASGGWIALTSSLKTDVP